MNIWQKLTEAQHQGRAAVLVTVVAVEGSAPREVGAKMLVYQDGSTDGTVGGGAVEKAAVELCGQVLQQRRPLLMEYDLGALGMSCGGRMKIFFEPYFAAPPLFIFGAGHIGKALAEIAHLLQFRITVVDDRPEFAVAERFPHAEAVLCCSYGDSFSRLEPTPDSYIVIVTYRHMHDQTILAHCAQQPFAYLGMIGSRTKVSQTIKTLKEQGISAEALARVHSPIGLKIGARTPEEIAVAVAAEMIAVRNGADLTGLSMKITHD